MSFMWDDMNGPSVSYTDIEEEANEDTVSRKAVKNLLNEYYAELTLDEKALEHNAFAIRITRNIMNDIESLPFITLTRKKVVPQKSIIKSGTMDFTNNICPICNTESSLKYKFCPNCGVQWIKPKESEE